MKIYLAGTPGQVKREREWNKLSPKRLLSFWDISMEAFAVKESFLGIHKKKK